MGRRRTAQCLSARHDAASLLTFKHQPALLAPGQTNATTSRCRRESASKPAPPQTRQHESGMQARAPKHAPDTTGMAMVCTRMRRSPEELVYSRAACKAL